MPERSRSILQELKLPVLEAHLVRLFVKRDDLIDPEISGNKWRKLKYYIAQIHQRKQEGFITFGGGFSNHLVAAAAAAKEFGLKSVGIVRGDELNEDSNETLRRCSELGMHLRFVSRQEYLLKEDRSYIEDLLIQFPNHMIIPEGGAGFYGMLGCQELVSEIRAEINFDRIVVAQGTTTTSCGIVLGLQGSERVDVVPVLKGFNALETMRTMLGYAGFESSYLDELLGQVTVHPGYHFEGYAKVTPELLEFIRDFYRSTGIKLDPVYTGKAMFALMDLIKQDTFKGETIVFVHTGGIQGSVHYSETFGELYPNN